ncbi:MAG: hypothetical protein ACRERV_14805 [Methylococcales bacterium]
MSDNVYKYNKRRPSIVSSTGSDEPVIVLHPYNPTFLWVFAGLFAGLISTLALFAFLSRPDVSGNYRSGLLLSPSTAGLNSNSLAGDVEFIKGEMDLLITGAMESKIQQLEASLTSGIVSRRDLATLQELKESLNILKAYSVRNAAMAAGLLGVADRTGGSMQTQASLYSDKLLREVSNIRNLLYIGIISWGGVILIIGGAWLRGYYRFRQIQCEQLFRHRLLDKPKTGYD